MKRVTDFIINKRYFILILFIVLAIVCTIISGKVNINQDMTKYLPSTSETRRGMNIMEEEFADIPETSSFDIMFKGLTTDEKITIYNELQEIENVDSVDYNDTEEYNRDEYTLYIVNVNDTSDSECASQVYNDIIEKYVDYEIATSGAISESNMDVLPTWILVVAVLGVFIILIFMCESYIEPVLFLFSILIAVLLNNGTNIIFDSVSMITSSISAILQLALSMDYSIMLMNRFRQEKEVEKDKVKAMKNALYHAFKSISSSSITTIVGLVALVFMSFTIGKDLGLVLAKGVLLSLISIFCVLPGLILIFDKLITKTKKKNLNIKLNRLGSISNKIRFPLTFAFLVVFVLSFLLKGNLNILYTASEVDDVSKIFEENNQMAIIYKNEDEEKVSKYLKYIEQEEKVKEVLGYGNTINEKLTTEELLEKLQDLGSDVNIENYLLKIIYYKYYNPNETNNMTFDEIVKFIQNDVYNNPEMAKKLGENIKDEINTLSNFTDKTLVNKEITSSEIADILGMEESDINDILVYYNSKNNNLQITLNDFVNFMNNVVLKDSKYSSDINEETRNSLAELTKFTNSNTIGAKLTSKEMANIFGMSESTMESLYTYYVSTNEITNKLTLSQFANFVLSNVLTNPIYASMFNNETINNIKILSTFSNTDVINQNMNSLQLANLLGIDEASCNKLLLLKYMNSNSNSKLLITDFIKKVTYIKNNTNYLNNIDTGKLDQLYVFASNENNLNNTPMNKAGLAIVFDKVAPGLVGNIYLLLGLDDSFTMTPQNFINSVINQVSNVNSNGIDIPVFNVDESTLNQLKLLKMIIDESISGIGNTYSSTEMASILNFPQNQMNNLYVLIDFTNGNTNNWKSTPYEFVNLILSNKENEQIKNSMSQDQINNLNLLIAIMNSSLSNQAYSYNDLASFINSDINNIKNIYSLYIMQNTVNQLTPIEFVNFVLNHKDDSILKNNLNTNTVDSLELVQLVMNGTINNTKYSSSEISSLLGINNSQVDLLYGLYISKNISINQKISLNTLVNFIVTDVMNNSKFSEKINEDSQLKLNTIQTIIKESNINTKYTKDEMIAILNKLSDKLDNNMIELLYLYYGSAKEYNVEWKLTVEEFANYLYNNILNDNRFQDFIDDEMRKNINDSKDTVDDAKKMLVGNNYSRIVINTTLDPESEQTFNFIQKIEDSLRKENSEIYIIGDSPMAYEMSKTFTDEFNYISILTMIAIFVVVAITFKSLLIPLILVAVIQCAVYMTMGILSLSGGSVYYLALLIVQSILMGSTIDYAILYTSYYLEYRETMNKKESIINAYNESIHTILTSASILIIVTFIVGNFATAITAKICMTLSQGTLCAELLILIFLPGLLATFDKLILKKND